MKAFLIFLAVGGAILYGLLAFTQNALQDGKSENTLTAQTQSSHPAAQQLSSGARTCTMGILKPKTRNFAGNLSANRCIAHAAEPGPSQYLAKADKPSVCCIGG